MSAEILEKSKPSKNIIKYLAVLLIFLGALWLSIQSEGQSKFPKFLIFPKFPIFPIFPRFPTISEKTS